MEMITPKTRTLYFHTMGQMARISLYVVPDIRGFKVGGRRAFPEIFVACLPAYVTTVCLCRKRGMTKTCLPGGLYVFVDFFFIFFSFLMVDLLDK